jgi:hypothetical protein
MLIKVDFIQLYPMNKRIFLFFILHSSFFIVYGQELKKVENTAFIRGEEFSFRAYYDSFLTGKMTAGVASLEIDNDKKEFNGRTTYHITGKGKSKGTFNLFFKVDDKFESYIDEEYIVPWYFIRKTREGDYRKNDEVRFNQYSLSASSSTANKTIPAGTQDIISVFYFARTLDFTDIKVGDNIALTYFLDDSVYNSVLRFAGHEEIEIDLGKFRCLKFKPMVLKGKVFSQSYAMDIWITDDKNHIPILAKSVVIVGSVKLELIQYKNLANPVTSLITPQKK